MSYTLELTDEQALTLQADLNEKYPEGKAPEGSEPEEVEIYTLSFENIFDRSMEVNENGKPFALSWTEVYCTEGDSMYVYTKLPRIYTDTQIQFADAGSTTGGGSRDAELSWDVGSKPIKTGNLSYNPIRTTVTVSDSGRILWLKLTRVDSDLSPWSVALSPSSKPLH